MSVINTKNIKNLSIYPDKAGSSDEQDLNETKWKQDSTQTVGVTTMSLVSEVKQKYHNTLQTIDNFKNYVTSTEGKIKIGVMFVGFSGGCILAYRSKSKSVFYKRLIPASTLTLAASACYPYTAWEVSKRLYRGSVVVGSASARGVSYIYNSVGAMYANNEQTKPVQEEEEKELVYTIDDRGVVDRSDETHETTALPSKVEEKPDAVTTVLKLLSPTVSLNQTKETPISPITSLGDVGQSSPEDKDLYTTRM